MSQQTEIYTNYLKKFYTTHKEIALEEIEKPNIENSVIIDCVYIYSSIYEVFKLKDGRIVSGQTNEWTRGLFSKWFKGSYREIAENTPMGWNEYFEF